MRDRGDDRQPEAEAFAVAHPVAGQALEGLEQPLDLLGGHDRPGVGDRELDLAGESLAPSPGRVRPAMLWRSALSTRFDTSRSIRRRSPLNGAGSSDASIWTPRAAASARACGDRLAGDRGQVDPLPRFDPALPVGQGEERVDQLLLLGALVEHLLAGRPERAGRRLRVAQDQLKQRADRGQRRAELVRGVGDEPPLGVERAFEATQKAIDRVGELPELVLRSLHREPFVQIGFGYLLGGGGHRAQRRQHASGHDPAERGGYERHDRERDARLDHELMEIRDALDRTDAQDHAATRGRLQQSLDRWRQRFASGSALRRRRPDEAPPGAIRTRAELARGTGGRRRLTASMPKLNGVLVTVACSTSV